MNTAGKSYGFHRAMAILGNTAPDPAAIKCKACELGADLVNICRLNPAWLRSPGGVKCGDTLVLFPWVIVIGVAMNPEKFRTSPSPAIQEETQLGYRKMQEIACAVGEYVCRQGYNAFSSGNGEALSVPLAVDAGMGKLGRNGMLMSPEYGPCMRICKVFTDMPLSPDAVQGNNLAERCSGCSACSDACPAHAIEQGSEPAGERWMINEAFCGKYWKESNSECAACISACPATFENTPAGQ